MKKILIAGLLLASISSVISSCKKGEEDPFLSLRSRKARVAGEWTVVSAESKQTENETGTMPSTSTNTSSYNGSVATTSYTYTSGGTSISDSDTESYTINWTIEKDNTYKMVYTATDGSYTEEGTWNFFGKNKAEDLKNKEAITFIITKETYTGGGLSSVYNYKTLSGSVYVIEKLKNKEMTLKVSETYSDEDSNDTFESTMNLEQK